MENKRKKANKTKKIMFISSIIIFLLFGSIDRISKYYARLKLKDHPNFPLIPGKIELHYLENSGAAFGLLKGQEALFIFVSIVIICSILYVHYKIPAKAKYYPIVYCLTFIATGASGNMIDRVLYHHVVDFIFISSIRFPIFNLADIYVTLATLVMVILIILKYKEEDLDFLRYKEKKLREI